MKVLVPTDSFPPICGGSGWSTYALARGLRAKGHDVVVVQPRPGTATGPRERQYGEFKVLELGTTASNLPYLRNYDKNEGLYPAVADMLARLISREGFDVVHGQHVMTCLPAIEAAHEAGIPAVCTVRDYWPVCYWSDLIHTSSGTSLCPACSTGMMTRCIRPRGGVLWPLALPMIPYMRANLGRKRAGLAEADAVIAVSSRIASDLRARAPELSETRIEIIPNAVEAAELRAQAAAAPPPVAGPYALYLGKLAPNKGTSHLVDVVERAGLDWPLVIVGDGPDRAAVESAAKRSDRDIRVVGWVGQHQTAAWLGHAAMLVFTSRGPESLSRVLIEASALGVPIAAMNTGGTPDIVTHDETGLLSDTPEALAEDVKRLRNDEALRRRLGDGARRRVERDFDIAVVTGRIEALYEQLRRPGGPLVRTVREDPS